MSESTNTVLMLPAPATNLEAPMAEAETLMSRVNRRLRDNARAAGEYTNRLREHGVDSKELAKSWRDKVVEFSKKSVSAAQQQAASESKLKAVLKSRTNATENQIKAIMQLTAQQQANGVVSDEIQMAGAAQLSTYVNNADTIKTLIPALNNLTVAQKGFGATGEDAASVADLMGKGLNGQTEELEDAGLAMKDYQKQVLQSKDSTMEQKATVLTEAIQQNVGEENKNAAQSDSGKFQEVMNGYQNIQAQVGAALLPILSKVAGFFFDLATKYPKTTTFIITFISAVTTLLAVIGAFSQIMMVANAAQTAFGIATTVSMGPIILIVAVIAALIAGLVLLVTNWDKVTAAISRFIQKHPKLKKIMDLISKVVKFFKKKDDGKESEEDNKKSKKNNKKEKKQKINPLDVPYKQGTTPSLNGSEKKQNKLKRLESIKDKRTNVSYGKNALAYIDDEKKNNSKINNNSEATGKINKITENKTVTFGNINITAKGVSSDEVIKELVPKLKLQLTNVTQTA